MKSKSRLFFALVPSDELVRKIVLVGDDINKKINACNVTSKMIHMTLRYIGQTEQSVIDCLISAADSISAPAFTIHLNRTDYRRKPKVIWCEPEHIHQSLTDLVNELEKYCQQCGLPAEQKTFKPHVTLLRKAKIFETQEKINLPVWKVNEFVLLESVSVDAGVEYRELKRWVFKT